MLNKKIISSLCVLLSYYVQGMHLTANGVVLIDDTDFYHTTHNDEHIKWIDEYVKQLIYANANKMIMMNSNTFDTLSTTPPPSTTTTIAQQTTIDVDEYSKVLWYVIGFSGLIAFFLVVSCSEWCCRVHANHSAGGAMHTLSNSSQTSAGIVPETPPPAYDLFAPPSYDSLTAQYNSNEKSEFDVYVVPVHALGSMLNYHHHINKLKQVAAAAADGDDDDEPPSYSAVNMQCLT